MTVEATTYTHLEPKPGRRSAEFFIRGSRIRAPTVWHDRYVSRMTPVQIAADREISVDAVREALRYCQKHWETICEGKDAERERLQNLGFFEPHMDPVK